MVDKSIKRSKILICGGSSLLSFMWCNALSTKYDICLTNNKIKTNYLKLPIVKVNLFSVNSILKVIEEYSIDIVINTIGLTSVEECELKKEEAYLLNATVPGYIAKACQITQRRLIHISTDHFFDDEELIHTETDSVKLKNIYAKSKYKGELNVMKNMPEALICRTNFFGNGPKHKMSFSDWIIYSINSCRTITLHNDVTFTPIIGKSLAYFAHKLLEKNCNGIYNISSNEVLNKYQFGLLLCNILNLPNIYIKEAPISKRKDLIRRPKSMALSNSKMSKVLNLSVDSLTQQIQNL